MNTTMENDDCQPCYPDCPSVFHRVVIRNYLSGGTVVMWELLPTFTYTGSLEFTLQVNDTPNPNSGTWTNVGLPVTNQYSAVDSVKRAYGKINYTYYRVMLETAEGIYFSTPQGALGILSRGDWLYARELIRKKKVLFRKGYGAQEGYLLKRRISGTKCRRCNDLQTGEILDQDCPACYGTGYVCGYYYPMSCVWADISPEQVNLNQDDSGTRGTVNDIVVGAEMLLIDMLAQNDVWVARRSDERYLVRRITHTEEVRGVVIAGQVELRLLPYSSPIYGIQIPDQFSELERLAGM